MKLLNILDSNGNKSFRKVHQKLLKHNYQLSGELQVGMEMIFQNETSTWGIWTSPVLEIQENKVITLNSIYIFDKIEKST